MVNQFLINKRFYVIDTWMTVVHYYIIHIYIHIHIYTYNYEVQSNKNIVISVQIKATKSPLTHHMPHSQFSWNQTECIVLIPRDLQEHEGRHRTQRPRD